MMKKASHPRFNHRIPFIGNYGAEFPLVMKVSYEVRTILVDSSWSELYMLLLCDFFVIFESNSRQPWKCDLAFFSPSCIWLWIKS